MSGLAPACGFYLPPSLSSAAGDAVSYQALSYPNCILAKWHKHCPSTLKNDIAGLFESLGPGPPLVVKIEEFNQWKTCLLHTTAVVL